MARKKSEKTDVINEIIGDETFEPIKAAIDDVFFDRDTARLITPRQVAEMLFISARTLSRWCIALQQSLSETASRRGRKRFFSSSDIQQLQKAQSMLNDGLTIEDAAKQLPVITPEEEQQTALVLAPEHAYQLGQLVTQAERLVREVDRLREANARLEEQNEDIRYRVERLERQAEWRKQPVWKRLFRSPNEWAEMEERLRLYKQEHGGKADKRITRQVRWATVMEEKKPVKQDDNPTDTDQ